MRIVASISAALALVAFIVLYYTHATRDLLAALWFTLLSIIFYQLVPRDKR